LLGRLASAQGSLLDDTELIDVLATIKLKSKDLSAAQLNEVITSLLTLGVQSDGDADWASEFLHASKPALREFSPDALNRIGYSLRLMFTQIFY
jgi:hypothetical protein